jgi:hypothetical protein
MSNEEFVRLLCVSVVDEETRGPQSTSNEGAGVSATDGQQNEMPLVQGEDLVKLF